MTNPTLRIYSFIRNKSDKSLINFSLMKSSKKYLIFLSAFYLFMCLMKSAKNFEKIVILKTTCSELGIFMYRTGDSMNNLLSCCGLVDAKIGASDNYLPVHIKVFLSKAKINHLCHHLTLIGLGYQKLNLLHPHHRYLEELNHFFLL